MINKVLAVRLADIGDVLTATPALRAVHETYPDAQVDLLTTPHAAPVVPDELVSRILVAPRNLVTGLGTVPAFFGLLLTLRLARYDAILLLHHLTLRSGVMKYRLLSIASGARIVAGLDNGKGRWLTHRAADRGFGMSHEVQYALDVAGTIGARTADTRLAAHFGERDLAHAAHLLLGIDGGPWVAIHPGSGGYAPARRYPAERWAEVADALVYRHGARIVLVGTEDDGAAAVRAAMNCDALDVSGRTSLPQLAALLSQCDLFLGADSGVMHLAAATGVPLVAVFGPSNHSAWGPWTPGGRSAIVRLDLDCSPCTYVGNSIGKREGCAECRCMAELPAERVLDAAELLMGW